jgi:hypothetical protein
VRDSRAHIRVKFVLAVRQTGSNLAPSSPDSVWSRR